MTTQPRRPGRPTASSPTLDIASRRGVPRKQLAELFDVPPTTVDAWRRAGCPQLPEGLFRPASVLAWLRRRDQAKVEADGDRARGKAGVDWEEQSRRALALNRMHDLAVKRGEFLPRAKVIEEWAKRCFAFRTRFLQVPRAIAGAVNVPPDVRAQIETEGLRLVRDALMDFVRRAELTPTPTGFEAHTNPGPAVPEPNPPESTAGTSPASNGHNHHRTDS